MTVLITGASRGIGHALAKRYELDGRQVIATSRGAETPDHRLDVSDPASISAFAEMLAGTPIDLLICNAGIFPDKGQTLEDGYPAPMWEDVFRTNVTGVFLVIQALLPNLALAPGPRIAILSSRLGSSGHTAGGRYIYRASKAAVLNLGRNLAVDLAPKGISVGIYHPGWVRTDMGGPEGEIDLDASVTGLIERFEVLSPDTSGVFETWDGRALPH